jgi:serine/threonine protein phosphatase PrpC
LFVRFPNPADPSKAAELGVICDGMGGMAEGGRCAEIAISTFVAHVLTSKPFISPAQLVSEAAANANATVYDLFKGQGGSTLSAFLMADRFLVTINVGDSRIYAVLENGTVEQLSVDDTVSGRLALLGTPAEPHPRLHNELLQFIGFGSDLMPHVKEWPTDPFLRSVILATDGAYRPSAPVLESLIKHANTTRIVVEHINNVASWLGGEDNITCLAASVKDSGVFTIDSRDPALVEMWGPPGSSPTRLPVAMKRSRVRIR